MVKMKYFKKVKTYMMKKECYGEENMEIGYQKDIDDLGIILVDDYDYDRSIEVDAGFIVDVDKNNKLVAIEVIDCSTQIDESLEYVEKAKKDVYVEVYEFSYKIIISFNDGEKEIIKRLLK